ncbi:MAG: family 20 glycosylhydrolase [Niabella sp.]
MNRITLIILAICLSAISRAQQVNIIPRPVEMAINEGVFTINGNSGLVYSKNVERPAKLLANRVGELSGFDLFRKTNTGNKIRLQLNPALVTEDEGYRLNVTTKEILITGHDEKGVFFGVQSLIQLLPPVRTNQALQIPCLQVKDYPQFKWRGLHLDVCRHFFSPEMVKEYIDLIAFYKLNTFHWHLTDDQAWRIEIKKYPRLTFYGAWRADRWNKTWSESDVQQPGETASYGGFYTQEQVREIVAYAADRGVTIVPEIEMPGHAQAAVAAYPQLSCRQQPNPVLTGGVYPRDVQTSFCAGNDSVFTFLQDVLTEVMQLFPSKYIHVGGDELDKTFWKECPKCQQRKKVEELKNEEELQSYFMKRIEKFLVANHRRMIGWDEILEGGLAPEATVMSWRGEAGGIAAAKQKHDVVMTPATPLYFDYYQAGASGEPQAFGGFNTAKLVYEYNPVPVELTAEEGKYILGAQANIWTEFIKTRSHLEYMVLPRMAALSEMLWLPKEKKDWDDFSKRLKVHFRMYDMLGLNYSKGNYTVAIKPLLQDGRLFVSLSNEVANTSIYYTTDGSMPTLSSHLYKEPFPVTSSIVVKAVSVENATVMNNEPAMQTFSMHKAIGGKVSYVHEPNKSYLADGPNTLVDGIRGTFTVNKFWHGFNGDDLIATIDLGTSKEIEKITLGCLQKLRDWIFLPTNVQFEVSQNGKDFVKVGAVVNDIPVSYANPLMKDFTVSFAKQSARFVRVTAKVLPVAPKGHPGEGQPVLVVC